MRGLMLAGAAAVLLLAGCTTGSTPAVTIAAVQAESQAIVVALAAGAKVYTSAPTTTPAEAAAVENMLTEAVAADAALQGEIPTSSTAAMVEAASQDIAALLGVLPIDPITKVAIDAGLAILDTFIAEQMATPVAPSASPNLTLRAVAPVAPPVPIPAPHRLPPTGSPPAGSPQTGSPPV